MQVPHGRTIQHRRRCLAAFTAAAARRKSAWRIPSSARQQRVSYDGSSARHRCHFASNGYACCSFGGSRLGERHERSFGGIGLSPAPPTRLDGGSSCAKRVLVAENARSAELRTNFRLPHTAILPHTNRLQKEYMNYKLTRLTIRRPIRIQSKTVESEWPFSTQGSDFMGMGLKAGVYLLFFLHTLVHAAPEDDDGQRRTTCLRVILDASYYIGIPMLVNVRTPGVCSTRLDRPTHRRTVTLDAHAQLLLTFAVSHQAYPRLESPINPSDTNSK